MNRLKHIVLGHDLSEFSDQALNHALAISTWNSSTLHIIHIINYYHDDPISFMPSITKEDLRHETIKRLQQKVNEHSELIDGFDQIEFDVRFGDPTRELEKKCVDVNADLLILGSKGTSHPKANFGDVARKCLHRIQQKILLVSNGNSLPIANVVACIDFSPQSNQIMQQAIHIALQNMASLNIIHVHSAPWRHLYRHSLISIPPHEYIHKYHHNMQEKLSQFIDTFSNQLEHIDYHSELVENDQHALGIIEYAKKSDADLVVLGCHNSSVPSFFLGSTAEHVLAKAHCNVLAYKTSESTSEKECLRNIHKQTQRITKRIEDIVCKNSEKDNLVQKLNEFTKTLESYRDNEYEIGESIMAYCEVYFNQSLRENIDTKLLEHSKKGFELAIKSYEVPRPKCLQSAYDLLNCIDEINLKVAVE